VSAVNAIWEESMKTIKSMKVQKFITATGGLAALGISEGAVRVEAGNSLPTATQEKGAITVQGRFYCHIKALQPAERARHQELTEKLIRIRKEVVETEKGYEFQYSPSGVSIGELAEWVAAEGKCCPFFDFHIDLEREGALLCLRLSGAEGIKAFIRSEFAMPAK
jgi:hypothetical protein